MPKEFSFQEASWFSFLPEDAKRLVRTSEYLYWRELRMKSHLPSYSFVVFPMAKAYEGFLKLYLQKAGLLNRPDYSDAKFRIGRALNPDISDRHRNEWWLYDDLERLCSGQVARALWDAWIECRNHVFHFFFDEEREVTLPVAKKRLLQMSKAMEEAMLCLQKD